MEENKKYKAVDIDVDGPFDGWIIEELDQDEYKEEAAKAEEQANKKVANEKQSAEALEQKRKEQLAKIKALIDKKKKMQDEQGANGATAVAPKVNNGANVQNKQQSSQASDSPFAKSEQDLEEKARETGIPVEVLKMIEAKKEEIRQKRKNEKASQSGKSDGSSPLNGGGKSDKKEDNDDKKGKKDDAPSGVEIADTVKQRRENEANEKNYEERQVRKVVKKKVPVGEEIGDRKTLEQPLPEHDLYNVFDDVGLEDHGMDSDR